MRLLTTCAYDNWLLQYLVMVCAVYCVLGGGVCGVRGSSFLCFIQRRFNTGDGEEYWNGIGHAEAGHCLRSLHIHLDGESVSHELSTMLSGLCMRERLTELTIDAKHGLRGTYVVSL